MQHTILPAVSLISLLLGSGVSAEPVRVLDTDFPDPALIYTNNEYYAFATTGHGVNVQVAQSADFTTWTLLSGTDPLPGPFPSWVASSPGVWAPDVIQLADGTYVLYYAAATASDTSKHCTGAATSATILGPYTPVNGYIACPLDQGGAIDPDGFIDSDGTIYVVYKIDGNSLDGDGTTHSTPIMLQKLEADGVTPSGNPIQLLDRSDADGPLIEAPSLVLSSGTYYLSFSSNYYNTLYYDTSYATASSVTGPFTKAQAPNAPLIVSGDASSAGSLGGPGSSDFSTDGKKILFHAFENGQNISNGRALYTSGITLKGGVISLA